jgi:hypothetical protein
VLYGVLERDGQHLSASQTRHRALANADHPAILNTIWTDLTTAAREQHYWNLLPQRHEFEREAVPVAGRYRRVRSAWPARRRAAGSTSASRPAAWAAALGWPARSLTQDMNDES